MAQQMKDSTLSVVYDGLRILPGPQVSITKTPVYNNGGDNIISNTFQITLTGYASSYMPAIPGLISRGSTGTSEVFWSLNRIQRILERNGKILTITKNCPGSAGIVATGGKLISFDVQEGTWFNYAQYTATLEFSDVSFGDSPNIDIASISTDDPFLAECLYRLQSYNDNWNFTVPETEAHMYYSRIMQFGEGELLNAREDYSQIHVTYTINATGKNYYTANNTAISAWEAAKNFVQYKMWGQINMFRKGGVLAGTPFMNTSYDSREENYPARAKDMISDINVAKTVFPPILDVSIVDRYAIFNESIECNTSQTDGSFSATYSCILKRSDLSLMEMQPTNSVHTFTVSYDQARTPTSQNRTITVNGSLQGLLRTNILTDLNDGQQFVLPQNGFFFWTDAKDTVSKYGNAYEDFVNYIGLPDIGDLKPNFKTALAINYESLFPATPYNGSPCVLAKGYAHAYQILAFPKDFSVSSNYKDGIVEYSATYDTERSCAQERGFNTMTITEDDAVPLYAEHQVIGRSQGPLVQNLNTNSHKTITITFEGVTRKTCRIQNPWSRGLFEILDPKQYEILKADVCQTEAYTYLPYHIRMIFWMTEIGAIRLGTPLLTKDFSTTYKPSDGTYTVTKQYIVLPHYPTDKFCVDNPLADSNVGFPGGEIIKGVIQ